MFIIYVFVSIIVVCIAGVMLTKRKPDQDYKPESPETLNDVSITINLDDIQVINDEKPKEHDFFESYVAGASYRCTFRDYGGFIGRIIPEPTNLYDKNAMAIIRSDGKHIGYIPKEDLKEYHSWCQDGIYPCEGYITKGDNSKIQNAY